MNPQALRELLRQAPLIASAQASPGSPLGDAETLLKLAQASLAEGCRVIRAEGAESIRLIKARTDAVVVGLIKREYAGSPVYITPTAAEVAEVVEAGAEIVALDATRRERPGGESFAELARLVHQAGRMVMADCDTVESAKAAIEAGADVIGTTLAGYTSAREAANGPDLELLRELKGLDALLVAEGRYYEPWQARAAMAAGADAVTIGGALNDPIKQTRRFAQAIEIPQEPVGAVDIGGTWIRFGILSPKGELTHSERESLPRSRDERYAWILARLKHHGIKRVGVGAGGIIHPQRREVVRAKSFIHDYTGSRFCWPGVESFALNDGHATVWGHSLLPQFAGRRVACLALGTGVGCGLVDRGHLLMGPEGEHPQMNDLTFESGETIEDVLGGLSLTQDPHAHQRQDAVRAAQRAIEAARRLWLPEAIILCGGVGLSDWVREALSAEPDIVFSPFGKNAGLVGAGHLALYPPEECR